MAANRVDPPKSEAEKAAGAGGTARPGGLKAWLPLLVTLVTMPALAYAITTFVLVPQLQKGLGITPPAPASAHAGGEKKAGTDAGTDVTKREMFPMSKVLVNVAGTMGSRYLLASFTLASNDPNLRPNAERNDAQLRDLACGILSTKTISDLEKPTIRNLIRSELISAFNNVLGPDTVQEIYITEFAIQ